MSDVYVFIYDLSNGLAEKLSFNLLGKQIDGIWHTGIVVFKKEIYFGSSGIESCQPEGTILGPPHRKVLVGLAHKTDHELSTHLSNLSKDMFHGSKYDILNHNCNTFSNHIATWLTGKGIPSYVIDLPKNVMSTPFGNLIQPFVSKYSPVVSATYEAAVTSYNNLKASDTDLVPVYFKEPLSAYVTEFIMESNSLLELTHRNLLIELIYSTKNQQILNISNDLHDLIRICTADTIDIRTKLVVFDVLRYSVTNNVGVLSIIGNFFGDIVEALLHNSNTNEIENSKNKLICNVVGLMPDEQIIKGSLTMVATYALELLRSMACDRVASSVIRNVILHRNNLDLDTIIGIASALIYLISEGRQFSESETKENVMGSIYYLVTNFEEIKDLAKSYEINKLIRNETSFCRPLYQKLQ